jgi:hypothetical protein
MHLCFRIYCICFCYGIPLKELRADIRFHKGFCGVTKDSTVALRPLNPLPQSHWHRWIRFRGLIETAESASTVSLRPRKPNLFRRSFVLKTTFLCRNNVVDIFFKDSAVSLKPPYSLPRSHWNHGICFRGLIETAEAASTVSLRPLKPTISNDYLEFLGDFEAICEMALAPDPWP